MGLLVMGCHVAAAEHLRFDGKELLMGLAEVRIGLGLGNSRAVVAGASTVAPNPGEVVVAPAGPDADPGPGRTGLEGPDRVVEVLDGLHPVAIVVVVGLLEAGDHRVERRDHRAGGLVPILTHPDPGMAADTGAITIAMVRGGPVRVALVQGVLLGRSSVLGGVVRVGRIRFAAVFVRRGDGWQEGDEADGEHGLAKSFR